MWGLDRKVKIKNEIESVKAKERENMGFAGRGGRRVDCTEEDGTGRKRKHQQQTIRLADAAWSLGMSIPICGCSSRLGTTTEI
jgi:hypothetical protein